LAISLTNGPYSAHIGGQISGRAPADQAVATLRPYPPALRPFVTRGPRSRNLPRTRPGGQGHGTAFLGQRDFRPFHAAFRAPGGRRETLQLCRGFSGARR